jgi:hypothetical protein
MAGTAQAEESRVAVGQQHIVAIHYQPGLCKGDVRAKTVEFDNDAPQRMQGIRQLASAPQRCRALLHRCTSIAGGVQCQAPRARGWKGGALT